jgi:predicted unusual protein kinase regulating ubiquinone biosynthesis (AarF/ABC1/UbiB family)
VTSALDRDFNMWDAVNPFARTVLTSGGGTGGVLRGLGQQALSTATTLAALPKRLDELVTRIDRGQIAVRTPDIDRRLRSMERTIGRLVSAIVFAGLLFAGVLLLPTQELLGWILMGASAVPLIHVLVTWRVRS